MHDVRFLSPSSSSLVAFRRNEAGIEGLCFVNLDELVGLGIATGDVLLWVLSLDRMRSREGCLVCE